MDGETKLTVADIYHRLEETICNLYDDHKKQRARADKLSNALADLILHAEVNHGQSTPAINRAKMALKGDIEA